MCGIIGYNGTQNASETILDSLQKIEYRGYDSAGIAIMRSKDAVVTRKTVGGVDELRAQTKDLPHANMGIGHTRWATHGAPSEKNAHPHSSKNFTIAHNGIIENYQELSRQLSEKGAPKFTSDTDTEVLAWLLEHELKHHQSVRAALVAALKQVKGTYGLAVIHHKTPNVLYTARKSSPILIGALENGNMVASDPTALPSTTKHVIHLDDDQFAVVTKDSVSVYDLDHDLVNHKKEPHESEQSSVGKSGYDHYMLKEIHEQPESVAETLRGRLDRKSQTAVLGGLELSEHDAQQLGQLISVGCGTAYNSSMLASYLLEDITDVPLQPHIASEFLYRNQQFDSQRTLALAVSQSGETADTIAAVNKCNLLEMRTHGVVNVVGSNLTRLTDGGTYLYCGPEIAVASTKAFTSQVVAQLFVGLKLNTLRGKPVKNNPRAIRELQQLPVDLQHAIEATEDAAKQIAKAIAHFEKVTFLGRGSLFPVALEGALKYKEITYVPASAYPAGEMKHGPLALVDPDMLVVYLAREGDLFEKSVSNLMEIDARGGSVVLITDSKQLASERENAILLPKMSDIAAPLAMNVALQLLAYYSASERELAIDKPRNLAKSVTVE